MTQQRYELKGQARDLVQKIGAARGLLMVGEIELAIKNLERAETIAEDMRKTICSHKPIDQQFHG
jgi:hypothetical protein